MKESRRERAKKDLLDAAKTIVQQKGHDAVTVRNVAELAGFAHTNLYYYFRDLESLLWSLRLDMIEDMICELQGGPSDKADAVAAVVDAFSGYADYYFDHPNVFRFFYYHSFVEPEGDSRYHALEQRLQGTWQATFSTLIQEGIVQPADLEIVAKTIIYALQGMIMLKLSVENGTSREQTRRELSEIIRHLLGRPAGNH